MNNKRYSRLFLVFTALLVTVCRCGFDRGSPAPIIFDDGSTMKCTQYIDYFPEYRDIFGNGSTFDCDLPCPDGSTVSFKELSSPELLKAVLENGKVPVSVLQNLQKEYCTAASLVKATVTSTPAPTKTPTLTPIPTILTGEVTACDVRARFINLRLSQPVFDFSSSIVTININGVSSECVIPSGNPTILSCTLPQPLTFPVQIALLVNGRPANSNFSVDGSVCGYRVPNSPNDNPPPVVPTNPNDPHQP